MKVRLIIFLSLICISFQFVAAQDYKDFDAGVDKFRAKEYDAVIESFTAMLGRGHDKRFDEDLYFYRGQSYFHKGDYQKSQDDLNQSLALNHYNRGILYWYIARCQDKLGQKVEAEASYEQALTNAEKNKKITAEILADRARFHLSHGDKVAADKDLAMAKQLDPATKPVVAAQAVPQETRTSGGNTSQVIVQNNASQGNKKTSNPPPTSTQQQVSQPAAAEVSSGNKELVTALAAMYKDEKRYALVIGNSNYGKEIGILKNPLNDATDVATELRKSNFEVQLVTNATYVQMREAMRKFHEQLTSGQQDQTVGLFYYAGHGVAFQDENYLVPIDASVKYEDDIVRMCFPVQRMVLANMERSNSRMNIVILDACRNNPFPATTRSISAGLGEMKRARGSFIAYATAPGSVASDGVGRNGLYTQELIKAMRKSGLTIEQVFKEVRMNVLRLSGEKQYTWDSSNIIGEFYFKFQ
jgi:tetratricopeptide (TPR) repeat protein